MSADLCPVCHVAPAEYATARPELRLCSSCWLRMVATIREGRP